MFTLSYGVCDAKIVYSSSRSAWGRILVKLGWNKRHFVPILFFLSLIFEHFLTASPRKIKKIHKIHPQTPEAQRQQRQRSHRGTKAQKSPEATEAWKPLRRNGRSPEATQRPQPQKPHQKVEFELFDFLCFFQDF